MIIRRRKKPRQAARRLDLSAMREALDDGKLWCKLGLVGLEGDTPHFDFDDEGDLLIEVTMVPDGEEITARMGAMGGGFGTGIWVVPPKGAEVAVIIPDGDILSDPIIVGVLSNGDLPDGVAENTVVIAEGQVLIHDGTGGAVELALKSDVATLRNQVAAHSHVTTATIGASTNPGVISPTTQTLSPPAGTTVLKGK